MQTNSPVFCPQLQKALARGSMHCVCEVTPAIPDIAHNSSIYNFTLDPTFTTFRFIVNLASINVPLANQSRTVGGENCIYIK